MNCIQLYIVYNHSHKPFLEVFSPMSPLLSQGTQARTLCLLLCLVAYPNQNYQKLKECCLIEALLASYLETRKLKVLELMWNS